MTLSSEQAAQALRDAEAVEQRSGQLYKYQRSAPMLILWGVIWLIGFSLSDFFPARGNLVWSVLDCVGVLGCMVLGRGKDPAASQRGWRWLVSIFSIMAFYLITLIVMQPATAEQSAVLIALIVALFYVLGGLWVGLRLAVIGVALAALTLIGYYTLAVHFDLWMAVVGGGALILAGLWLRRA